MIVAQQFTAGIKELKDSQSVKRTAEKGKETDRYHSAVRFTDSMSYRCESQR